MENDHVGGVPDGDQRDPSLERLATLGEISAEIAHELRNVLQLISANAFLARQGGPDRDAYLLKIERHARTAHSIVDDLLALAQGDLSSSELLPLVDAMVASRSELAPDCATWEDEIEGGLRVRAHPGLLVRLFRVLYENAVHASAPDVPAVLTRARTEALSTVIEVEDDGPGVPPAIAPRIFEPLVTGRPGGTGFGLALARRIVIAHGGSIELVPTERGATFRIVLPS